MKTHLSIATVSILALIAPNIAKAQFTSTTTIGGVPSLSDATLENFDEASPSILSLSGNAFLTSDNISDAAPFFSGSTAAYFGESPNYGPDSSQYVLVEPNGSATLTFPTAQNYFGILWGSIDSYNYLTFTFYNGANNIVGTLTGSNIILNPWGDQGVNGTAYVNITSTTSFTSVVATSSNYSFEFDDVAYGTNPACETNPIPEPASYAWLSAGLCILGVVSRSIPRIMRQPSHTRSYSRRSIAQN
ncbi:MAG: hypothetical protein ACLQSR_15605 [Limisphaerales bacterium]